MKTIAHYLADLAIDLKITLDDEMSTAELTRCVERAVADYSRFNPREMSKEITVDAEVTSESFTTPAVSDPDYFVDAKDLTSSGDGDTGTLLKVSPDVPRPVLVTVTDANTSITQLVIIVKGYDDDNKYIEEFFYLEGGLVQTGEKYFALVTAVEIDEITGNGAGDLLDVGTGDADGVYVKLANKPIKFGSESIANLELDTAYEMDYAKGRIAMKSNGSMTVSTAYSITYTKSRIDIDLSTIIDEFIKIERVEYPVGTVPQQFSTPEVWGNILTLTGGHETQSEVTDQEHLLIRYTAPHSPPSAQAPGSYPSYLDCTVQLAASAYALFIEALQYEQQAVTDMAEVRVTLGYLGVGGATPTFLYKKAADALAKVITYLETNEITGDADDANARAILEEITAQTAELRTAIGAVAAGALGKGYTLLDKVATSSLDKATTGAEGLLDSGKPSIDAINDGVRVPENYREFAEARAAMASARSEAAGVYIQEAMARLANLNSYIAEAGAWSAIARGFADEASGHIAIIDRTLQEAMAYQQNARDCLELAAALKAEGVERRNEAWAIWASPNQIAQNYALGQRGQPA